MSTHRRPWWLLANRQAGLVTTIREVSNLGERTFIIHGEPLVQGLAWLVWGPVGALLMILVLTALAVGFNIREQSGLSRLVFALAYLGLPGFAWAIATIIANRLATKHIQAERDTETQACLIRLNQQQGEFFYQITDQGHQSTALEKLAYERIRGVHVNPAIGDREGKLMRLTLDTDLGTIVLLNETLGTPAQKTDLAHEIEASLAQYSDKQKSPHITIEEG